MNQPIALQFPNNFLSFSLKDLSFSFERETERAEARGRGRGRGESRLPTELGALTWA